MEVSVISQEIPPSVSKVLPEELPAQMSEKETKRMTCVQNWFWLLKQNVGLLFGTQYSMVWILLKISFMRVQLPFVYHST